MTLQEFETGSASCLPKSSEILTNEQIEQLLHEAETRLKEAASSRVQGGEAREDQDVIALDNFGKRKPLPLLTNPLKGVSYIGEKNGVAHLDGRRMLDEEQRQLANVLRTATVDQLSGGDDKKDGKPTSGVEWFDLPKTVLTPQLKRDLQLIEMRSVLDPHRHYKKTSGKNKVPEFSQVGTVIEGPTEWYSSRIHKKRRAENFVEEAMVGEKENGRFRRKYQEIQEKKTSGKRAYYKSLMERRKKRK